MNDRADVDVDDRKALELLRIHPLPRADIERGGRLERGDIVATVETGDGELVVVCVELSYPIVGARATERSHHGHVILAKRYPDGNGSTIIVRDPALPDAISALVRAQEHVCVRLRERNRASTALARPAFVAAPASLRRLALRAGVSLPAAIAAAARALDDLGEERAAELLAASARADSTAAQEAPR